MPIRRSAPVRSKFVEYVPGDHVTLERFADYWKPIPSNIKTLTFRFFT